jgi:SM-20-related protein
MGNMSPTLENLTETIINHLSDQGYAVIENFLPGEEIKALSHHAKSLQKNGEMHKAATGLSKQNTNNSILRGDFIHWIEASQACKIEQIYLDSMSSLQQAINQSFFLGLFELESHFAIYPPGAGYQKHFDQFIGRNERKVSCILYLNEDWTKDDGGALRMYLDQKNQNNYIDITPQAGTLVVFLSEEFLHEVLPAKRERISLTGWFRTRSVN